MNLRPSLALFFACEEVSLNVTEADGDLQFGWWEIRQPLYHVFTGTGIAKGFKLEELKLYFHLTDGMGEYRLLVEMRQLDLSQPKSDRLLLWSDYHILSCRHPLSVIEDVIILPQVPFPTPGLYQFQMKESGQVLPGGECHLRVFAGDGL